MYLMRKLSTLYFFRYFKKHNISKRTSQTLICFISFFILCFWFIIIPILINIYIGIIIYRNQIFKKIGNSIRNNFNRSFHTKYHSFIGIMIFLLYCFIFFMIIIMIFTIPIILLIIIGYLIEKREIEPKKNKKKQSYVYKYVETNSLDKKESTTTIEL